MRTGLLPLTRKCLELVEPPKRIPASAVCITNRNCLFWSRPSPMRPRCCRPTRKSPTDDRPDSRAKASRLAHNHCQAPSANPNVHVGRSRGRGGWATPIAIKANRAGALHRGLIRLTQPTDIAHFRLYVQKSYFYAASARRARSPSRAPGRRRISYRSVTESHVRC